ncbi:hypothetical protein QCE63_32140 [Caballeronia sp. LZ065]|uniref:hypothetical protein n=1 Tax=Caballeronia sp. LZ065 TaxID=3038571 RepID=UPI0028661B21|nr:hypothetical protein [Caballeronia sp. LZ065]MDR5784072.1 hypothetical protein [Caballeronia sp. LZ065]
MKLSKIASAMPFAHFLGLPSASASSPSAAARAEEDEDRKQREGESDDDYAKRMEEQDEKDKAKKAEQEERDKDARRAEQDDDDADAEADDKDDKEEGKRAGRANGARQRERVRCAAIVAEGVKRGMVKQACAFAFDTSMSAREAINALSYGQPEQAASAPVVPAARTPSLDERMARSRPANPGNSAPAAAEPDAADRILAATKRRHVEQ